MTAVTDHLAVNITNPKRRSHQSRITVMVGRHTVVYMSHGGGSVGNSQKGLLIGSRGMAHTYCHAV